MLSSRLRLLATRAPLPVPRTSVRTLAQDSGLEYASSCFLPTSWMKLPLLSRHEYNADTTIYDFGMPDYQSLNLPVCACILMRVPGSDGSEVVRPYTPISHESTLGKFTLLVKRYDGGVASSWLHGLAVGQTAEFKHISFNLKEQYPFDGKHSFSMICAGSGITPCYQALQKLLRTPGEHRKVTLLYGNRSVDDILLREELATMKVEYPDRLKIVHVIGDRPNANRPFGWETTEGFIAETGWINKAKIEEYCEPPSDKTLVFVCGLPAMYDDLCGPRGEKELKEGSILESLGYKEHMVAKM